MLRTHLDESLLAWTFDRPSEQRLGVLDVDLDSPFSGMLAESPAAFSRAGNIEGAQLRANPRFVLDRGGLLEFRPDKLTEMFEVSPRAYSLTLRCADNPHLATFCNDDECSHPSFTLLLSLRPCGHLGRIHCVDNLDGTRDSLRKVTPGIMYMHVSSASACGQLAEYNTASAGAERRHS